MNLLENAKNEHCNLAIADIVYNPHDKSLRSGQEEIPLEPRNIALLEVLLSNVDEPTSIDEFIESGVGKPIHLEKCGNKPNKLIA